MGEVVPWREAMRQALYDENGFFVRHRPVSQFRTSVTASPLMAAGIARLIERADAALGRPDPLEVVDVGAGQGELLGGIRAVIAPEVGRRLRAIGVEVSARKPRPGIDWRTDIPPGIRGVLLATEWLDNVPLDRVVGSRYVAVDRATGETCLGGPVDAADAQWRARWWPAEEVEIGTARDAAWAGAVDCLAAGVALTVDYGHLRADRPVGSTVAGYRDGRQVRPRFDGRTDITAHVALDSVAAAGWAAADEVPQLLRQRTALAALGITGQRPPLELAYRDPAAYVTSLATASQAHELTDPNGLGAHWWLLQPKAISLRLSRSSWG